MTTKTKYMFVLMALAIAGGAIFAIDPLAMTADADDKNKGIGETEIWEPGPTDGSADGYVPDRLYDARDVSAYDAQFDADAGERNSFSKDLLLEKFDMIRGSDVPLTAVAIDYEIGQLVLYAEDLTIEKEIEAVIGDFPYVLLYEKQTKEAGKAPGNGSVEREEAVVTPTSVSPLTHNGFMLFPPAFAVSDSAHGTHLDDDSGSSYTGAYARLEIHDSGVTIPSGVTVYAGNIMPNSNSSLEIAIEYLPSSTKVRVYDHADGLFTTSKTVDSTFMTDYATTISGKDYIYAKVEELSGTWKAYIWNKNISNYEFLDSQPDDGDREDGWSVWEEYDLSGECANATIPEINGDGVQVKHSGTWKLATSTHASQYNTSNDIPCYTENMDNNYYHWYVD